MEDQSNSGQGQGFIVTDDNLGEFKDHPAFQSFKGQPIGKVLKSIDNAHRLTEGQIVLPKGKNDTPENWAQVWDKLGRPESPDHYQFVKPRLPEGLSYDSKLERAFAAECHRLGILPKQAQGLFNFYNRQATEAVDAYVAERDQAYGKGHAALCEMFPDQNIDRVIKIANDMLCRFGGSPEEVNSIAQEYGNDPNLIALLYKIGSTNLEDTLVKGEKVERFDSKASALAEKKRIMYDKDHPLNEAYLKSAHPRHREAVETVLQLNTLLHGVQEED